MNEIEIAISYGATGLVTALGLAHFKGREWEWGDDAFIAAFGGVVSVVFWPLMLLLVAVQYLASRRTV